MLSLLPETVESYLRSAMRELGASTRFEAVVAARWQSLLPSGPALAFWKPIGVP